MLSPAFFTITINLKFMLYRHKAQFIQRIDFHILVRTQLNTLHITAYQADQMMVMLVVLQLEMADTAADIQLIDDIQLAQKLQISVHCGKVNAWILLSYLFIDFLRRVVGRAFLKGLDNESSLSRKLVALFLQLALYGIQLLHIITSKFLIIHLL